MRIEIGKATAKATLNLVGLQKHIVDKLYGVLCGAIQTQMLFDW